MLLERNAVRHVQSEGTLGVDVLHLSGVKALRSAGLSLPYPSGFQHLQYANLARASIYFAQEAYCEVSGGSAVGLQHGSSKRSGK